MKAQGEVIGIRSAVTWKGEGTMGGGAWGKIVIKFQKEGRPSTGSTRSSSARTYGAGMM